MRPVRAVQAVGIVLIAGAGWGDLGALIALLVLSVLVLVRVVWDLAPRRTRPLVPVQDSGRPPRFPAYDRLHSTVLLSRSSARHADLTLRPVLQRVLAADIDDLGEPEVRARLGERLWHLVDPGRPVASDSHGGGLSRQELSDILDRLEGRAR